MAGDASWQRARISGTRVAAVARTATRWMARDGCAPAFSHRHGFARDSAWDARMTQARKERRAIASGRSCARHAPTRIACDRTGGNARAPSMRVTRTRDDASERHAIAPRFFARRRARVARDASTRRMRAIARARSARCARPRHAHRRIKTSRAAIASETVARVDSTKCPQRAIPYDQVE